MSGSKAMIAAAVLSGGTAVLLGCGDGPSESVRTRIQSLPPPDRATTPVPTIAATPAPTEEPSAPQLSAKSIYAAEVDLLKLGGRMGKLRRAGDVEACVDMMIEPEALDRAEEMNRQSDGISMDYFDLKVAAGHMAICVTCGTQAEFNCGEAKVLLASTKKAHPELARK